MDLTDPLAVASEVGSPPAKAKRKPKPKKKPAKRKPKAKKRVVGPKKGQYRVVSAKRPAKRKTKAKKLGRKPSGIVRLERLDMRLSKTEKAKVLAKAKKTKRTVTSIVYEAIEKLKV